jgi:hypothetical protein
MPLAPADRLRAPLIAIVFWRFLSSLKAYVEITRLSPGTIVSIVHTAQQP